MKKLYGLITATCIVLIMGICASRAEEKKVSTVSKVRPYQKKQNMRKQQPLTPYEGAPSKTDRTTLYEAAPSKTDRTKKITPSNTYEEGHSFF